ncbi:hypothetical protein EG68_02618 [Paragonimus skrjabini miyazakii]|uniref:Uncharacterized protein n=1 Tax=Paragonimus skrjabini miyazakii TaxID=59628 RepID=A0A8S9Z5I2_9TREM|nr:hypothetical protein EG68_02618 [Paragonimus skrjabini miyazakii]
MITNVLVAHFCRLETPDILLTLRYRGFEVMAITRTTNTMLNNVQSLMCTGSFVVFPPYCRTKRRSEPKYVWLKVNVHGDAKIMISQRALTHCKHVRLCRANSNSDTDVTKVT